MNSHRTGGVRLTFSVDVRHATRVELRRERIIDLMDDNPGYPLHRTKEEWDAHVDSMRKAALNAQRAYEDLRDRVELHYADAVRKVKELP